MNLEIPILSEPIQSFKKIKAVFGAKMEGKTWLYCAI